MATGPTGTTEAADEQDDDAPATLQVRFRPSIQLMKLILILVIPALIAFAVLASDTSNIDPQTALFLAAIVVVALAWAAVQFQRLRDRRPQVTIGPDGIDARHWHAGTVPWENIEFIAHSRSVRRGIIQQIARSRRGPYILFKFRETPPFVGDAPFPLSLVQRLHASFEVQEPVILEHGLDASVNTMLNVIQDHLDAWKAKQPTDVETAPPIV